MLALHCQKRRLLALHCCKRRFVTLHCQKRRLLSLHCQKRAPAPSTGTPAHGAQHQRPALVYPAPSTSTRHPAPGTQRLAPCLHHAHSQHPAPAPSLHHAHASSQHQHRHPAPSTSNLSPPRAQPAHSTSTSTGTRHPARGKNGYWCTKHRTTDAKNTGGQLTVAKKCRPQVGKTPMEATVWKYTGYRRKKDIVELKSIQPSGFQAPCGSLRRREMRKPVSWRTRCPQPLNFLQSFKVVGTARLPW